MRSQALAELPALLVDVDCTLVCTVLNNRIGDEVAVCRVYVASDVTNDTAIETYLSHGCSCRSGLLNVDFNLVYAVANLYTESVANDTTVEEVVLIILSCRSKIGVLNGHNTASRAVLNYRVCSVVCCEFVCESTHIDCIVRCEIYIGEVQALDRSAGLVEQRSSQALDCETISENGLCVTLDWSPSLASHIDIRNKENILVQLSSLLSKRLQCCNVLNYEHRSIRNIIDCVAELANLTSLERFLVASLYGCIHYTTLGVVQSNIQLVVLACRNCNVEVGWLA